MYRGIKGTYLYACNKELRDYLKRHVETFKKEIPFRILHFDEVKPYVNSVPIYDIKVAATNFTDPQFYPEFNWVELPMQVTPRKGYFIAQVIGESMNKKIPNLSYCLFEEYTGGSRNGEIVLAECTNIQDGDYGSGYTIKEYSSVKKFNDESFLHESIILKPLSFDNNYENIVLEIDETVEFKVKGIFKRVLYWD